MSHELRTPVTALQLQLERLRRELGSSASARQRNILQRMGTSTARLAGMIESLLHHTRIESGHLSSQLEAIDVRALCAEVTEELRSQAEEKGLSLSLSAAPGLPALESDRQLVRIILTNLVVNAVKFTDVGGIEVSLSGADGAHRIAVRDSGPGIAPEHQARIFEPFEQIETMKKKHVPGVGLGLSLVKEMADALAGRIEIESRVGSGSTFTVVLPSPPFPPETQG